MAEEIDDKEFFREDFTTLSCWEDFNARLDEIFHDWKLSYAKVEHELGYNVLYLSEWEIKSEVLYFANVEMVVKKYKVKEKYEDSRVAVKTSDVFPVHTSACQAEIDMMSFHNSFCIKDENADMHPLAAWYGLREFVVIYPSSEAIMNESQYRLLLSSVTMVLNDSHIEIPVFISIMFPESYTYLGTCVTSTYRFSFDTMVIDSVPLMYQYLSGLLSMFKAKIMCTYDEPIYISTSFTYVLDNFSNALYSKDWNLPFSYSYASEIFKSELSYIPYGIAEEPIKEMVLQCIWPQLPENIVLDSATYSDFDPLHAPIRRVRVVFKQINSCYLSEFIEEYMNLIEYNETAWDILHKSTEYLIKVKSGGSKFKDKELTKSSMGPTASLRNTKSHILKSKQPNKPIEKLMTDDEFMKMLYYIFPDAKPNSSNNYTEDNFEDLDKTNIKTALPDSLVLRISTLLATCNSYYGGISALAYIWIEFCQELRYRVENGIRIPGVIGGYPDSKTCLFHQKLQMLNVCIVKKQLREKTSLIMVKNATKDIEDSDEEFFDCEDNIEKPAYKNIPWNKPQGRLKIFNNLNLIGSTEPIYIPITQEAVPKTEDQLQEEAEIMLKLGANSELCIQMMSASLLSDMESFKAANPGSKLEDFIRWYSPRDWVEKTDEHGNSTGSLSPRMLIPNNTWLNVWKTAKPVPAFRQKSLFDDATEAERVLHFFESRTIVQIIELTINALFHSAFLKLQKEIASLHLHIALKFDTEKLLLELGKLSRESWTKSNFMKISSAKSSYYYKKYDLLLKELSKLENLVFQFHSLAFKLFNRKNDNELTFDEINDILKLIRGYALNLDDDKSKISTHLLNLFTKTKTAGEELFETKDDNCTLHTLSAPLRKEFVLRLKAKSNHKNYGASQFLRAILDTKLRLCGSFSKNTTFC